MTSSSEMRPAGDSCSKYGIEHLADAAGGHAGDGVFVDHSDVNGVGSSGWPRESRGAYGRPIPGARPIWAYSRFWTASFSSPSRRRASLA